MTAVAATSSDAAKDDTPAAEATPFAPSARAIATATGPVRATENQIFECIPLSPAQSDSSSPLKPISFSAPRCRCFRAFLRILLLRPTDSAGTESERRPTARRSRSRHRGVRNRQERQVADVVCRIASVNPHLTGSIRTRNVPAVRWMTTNACQDITFSSSRTSETSPASSSTPSSAIPTRRPTSSGAAMPRSRP
jgi:hypothetical protein